MNPSTVEGSREPTAYDPNVNLTVEFDSEPSTAGRYYLKNLEVRLTERLRMTSQENKKWN